MLILASQSPRRRELLGLIAPRFRVSPTGCDETLCCADPAEHVLQLALRKARAAAAACPPEGEDCLIAADTVVALEGALLEKPGSPEEARDMLSRLSGRTHQVFTGVAAVFRGETRTFVQETKVTFYPLTEEEIDRYVASGEPMDKAGAYGIQGAAALFVKEIAGDYANVVGLPVARLARLLREWGVPLEDMA